VAVVVLRLVLITVLLVVQVVAPVAVFMLAARELLTRVTQAVTQTT
jgi:hypothetical protein